MEEDARPLDEAAPARPGDAQRRYWPDLSGIHVMLIEDNIDTRVMVGETLQFCGAIVTTYESAAKAMNYLSEIVPHVLICDLSMPGLDGLEFMLRLRPRRPEQGGSVPAIAITAYYEEFAAAAALEVGFDAYMTKPIKLEQLCRLVQELSVTRS